jgi:hypothetical protein
MMYKNYLERFRHEGVQIDHRKLCLILDNCARWDLVQCVRRGYVVRWSETRRGVYLLNEIGLIYVRRKGRNTTYAPTDDGVQVAVYLPSDYAEERCLWFKDPLVYADGTVIDTSPRYSNYWYPDWVERYKALL